MTDIVRVRIGDNETAVGRSFAEIHKLDILDEPAHTADGRLRADTHQGRRVKPKTTVAKSAAAKKTSDTSSAATKAVTQSADNKKEQDQ